MYNLLTRMVPLWTCLLVAMLSGSTGLMVFALLRTASEGEMTEALPLGSRLQPCSIAIATFPAEISEPATVSLAPGRSSPTI